MATGERRNRWWKFAFYATLVVADGGLLVAEVLRDDPRWWKLALNGVLMVVFIARAAEQLRHLKATPSAA